ncbi:MAG: hypothetical protein M3505_04740 [Verrucomicrobiota bacterium]|jgi:hypothetical protein|nr:hypothetical protein [Chthoniobacterales bacterium]MBA3762296.1 hypothetical protein [Chthoniobacterales bacterium]MDQ3313924.1 hypothetical protein [Verrucomicrobiota bacterium]
MKTFEENWTAWLDGELTGKELVEFEASLPDKPTAEVEKEDAKKLGAFLKEQLTAPAMRNEEFFHHRLREQMGSEAVAATPARVAQPELRETWWTIGRLLWTGATSLAIFAVCTFFVLREKNIGGQSAYVTQILNARVDPVVSPNATISMFETKEDKVTVLWVEGLQSLPSEFAAK